ncbi:Signal transduction histidine kinase [Armatimonadetes bacterium DC]|nr:Signal transduction histidine kinase [Armatimonadetes bacterium DC]
MLPAERTGMAVRPTAEVRWAEILDAVLNTADDGVLITDAAHRPLACNHRFGELFGCEIEWVVQADWDELLEQIGLRLKDPDEWRRQMDGIVAQPYRQGHGELALGAPEGFVLWRTAPIRSAQGEPMGRLWRFRDITEQKKRERIQQILYEVSTFFDPIPEKNYMFVLQKLSEFYGGTTAAITMRDKEMMIFKAAINVPEWARDLAGVPFEEAYCKRVVSTNRPVLLQNALQDGEFHHVPLAQLGLTRYLGAPVRLQSGQPLGSLCILDSQSDRVLDENDTQLIALLAMRVSTELERERVITERIAEQKAALEQRERLLQQSRQILDSLNQGLQLLSESVSPRQWLQRQVPLLCQAFFADSVALLARTGDDFWGIEWREAESIARDWTPSKRMAQVLERLARPRVFTWNAPSVRLWQVHYHALTRLETRSAPPLWLMFGAQTVSAFEDPLIKLLIDSLLKQIAIGWELVWTRQSLETAYEDLKNTQEQLIRQEKLAVAGTLAASVAHDIRNIISSLSLSLAVGEYDPKRALEEVRAQLDRFTVLVHRLLVYARPRLLARERVDLTDLLERVLSLIMAQARIGRVQVHFHRSRNRPQVVGDPHQLEHLFVNMCLNALQAMTPDGGHLTLRLRKQRGYACIAIHDTGKGIPPERLATLFEPFQSGHSEGIGLGLYSCRNIVEAHQGRIEVESQLGAGTTFRIWLPLAADQGGQER